MEGDGVKIIIFSKVYNTVNLITEISYLLYFLLYYFIGFISTKSETAQLLRPKVRVFMQDYETIRSTVKI